MTITIIYKAAEPKLYTNVLCFTTRDELVIGYKGEIIRERLDNIEKYYMSLNTSNTTAMIVFDRNPVRITNK